MPSPTCLFDATRRSVVHTLETDFERHGEGHTLALIEGSLAGIAEVLVGLVGPAAAYARLAHHADLAAAPIRPEPANRGE